MADNDLTTLARAKEWLGGDSTSIDATLRSLITRVSGQILGCLNRPTLYYREYSRKFQGKNTNGITLRNWPVLEVTQVITGDETITQAAEGDLDLPGWRLEAWDGIPPGSPQALILNGYSWQEGLWCQVDYAAGYTVTEEYTIASPRQFIPAQTYGLWMRSVEVTNKATGAAFTQVTGTPAAGQYKISQDVYAQYEFAAANDGVTVQILYTYVPYAVEQVTLDMVGELLSRRKRYGIRSASLAGQETSSYDMDPMEKYRGELMPYTLILPLSQDAP